MRSSSFASWLLMCTFVTFVVFYGQKWPLPLLPEESECGDQVLDDFCAALLNNGTDETLLAKLGCAISYPLSGHVLPCSPQGEKPRTLVFVGDSRMRLMFAELVLLFNDSYKIETTAGKHESLEYLDSTHNVKIRFFWIAFVDEVMLDVVKSLHEAPPDLVAVGSAVWTIRHRNGSASAFEEYKRNLTEYSSYLRALAKRATVLWILQDPVIESNLAERRKMITNVQIDRYNQAAKRLLCGTGVKIWEIGRQIAQHFNNSMDGLHVQPNAARVQAKILMNFWCGSIRLESEWVS